MSVPLTNKVGMINVHLKTPATLRRKFDLEKEHRERRVLSPEPCTLARIFSGCCCTCRGWDKHTCCEACRVKVDGQRLCRCEEPSYLDRPVREVLEIVASDGVSASDDDDMENFLYDISHPIDCVGGNCYCFDLDLLKCFKYGYPPTNNVMLCSRLVPEGRGLTIYKERHWVQPRLPYGKWRNRRPELADGTRQFGVFLVTMDDHGDYPIPPFRRQLKLTKMKGMKLIRKSKRKSLLRKAT